MKHTREIFKFHSLPLGLLLMSSITWTIELAHAGFLGFSVPYGLYLFQGWGFGLAVILVVLLGQGFAEVIKLLKRFLIWRVGWKWYGIAFLLYPSMYLAAVLFSTWITGVPPDFSNIVAHKIFDQSEHLWLFVVPFFLVDMITNGEEIGWRGFILPRLQVRYSFLVSSIILGLIWGLWHLPKNLAAWDPQAYGLFMVRITGDALLYSWLFKNTRGSLFVTSILHAVQNTAGAFLPLEGTVVVFTAGFTWAAALILFSFFGDIRFVNQALSRKRSARSDVSQ